MASKMKAAGKTVTLVELPRADHQFQRQDDRVTLLTDVEKFLAMYNPAQLQNQNRGQVHLTAVK